MAKPPKKNIYRMDSLEDEEAVLDNIMRLNKEEEKKAASSGIFGPMNETAKKIELENPFKTNNPSFIPDPFDPFEKLRKQLNERRRGPKNSRLSEYLAPKNKPTLQDVNKIFEQPRAAKWENERVEDFRFNTLEEQREKIRKNITPEQQAFKERARENTFKEKNPEPDYAPTGKLDYKDNVFEKLFKSNVEAQERANKINEQQVKMSEQQFNLNNLYWNATQKQKTLAKQREKVVSDYEMQSEKYSMMGSMAGLDQDIINNMNALTRKRAKERLDELKEDDI